MNTQIDQKMLSNITLSRKVNSTSTTIQPPPKGSFRLDMINRLSPKAQISTNNESSCSRNDRVSSRVQLITSSIRTQKNIAQAALISTDSHSGRCFEIIHDSSSSNSSSSDECEISENGSIHISCNKSSRSSGASEIIYNKSRVRSNSYCGDSISSFSVQDDLSGGIDHQEPVACESVDECLSDRSRGF